MRIHSPLRCAPLASLIAVLLAVSGNYVLAQIGTNARIFEYLQGEKSATPTASASSSAQSAAKAPGNVVIGPVLRISQASAASSGARARAAEVAFNPDDNEYLVVWQSDGLTEVKGVTDIYGQRINAVTGNSLGINFRISNLTDADRAHSANDPQVVYNRSAREYLVVWHGSGLVDAPDRFFEIYGQRLSRTGKEIGADFRISFTTDLGKVNTNFVRTNTQADVAWNSASNEYLIIWKGMGEPEDVVKMEIYGQRLKAGGEMSGKHFRISRTTVQGSNFNANAPAIAYNSRDNQYFVVWSGGFKKESQTEIFGKVVPGKVEALAGANEFRISDISSIGATRRAGAPRVAYNSAGNEYFVVFQANALSSEANANVHEIFGKRIDATKLVETESAPIRVSNTSGPGIRAGGAAVTYNNVDKEYLVTWRSMRTNAPVEIYGQKVSSTGTEIDGDFQISNIAAVGKDRSVYDSSVAHNSTNGQYFVVWHGNGLPANAKVNEIFGQIVFARPQR